MDCDQLRRETLLFLFKETCDELRARRAPEYSYVAASVAAFGAVAWGVATLASVSKKSCLAGSVAALGTLLIAGLVVIKILKEHGHYKKLREKQVHLFSGLKEGITLKDEEIYKSWIDNKAGLGHLWSILIVGGAAVVAAFFCWVV